jgi:DNA-binding IclR family transcriptional regulator
MAIGDNEGRTIRSVKIAFEILEALRTRNGAGVTELSNELGYAKSTVHSHLRTLKDQEVVIQEDDSYRLSLRFLAMATYAREQIDNYEVICNEVDKLADKTDEIAQFGIEEYHCVAYFYKAIGDRGVETASRVGQHQPIYSTALGKTILAYLPEQRREEIIPTLDLDRQTPNTITDQDELRDELEQIRDRGYGIDSEENIEGLRCVAAPVRIDEHILGALSISGPSSRFTDDHLHGDLSDYVQRAANVIELNTKFS